MYVHLHTWVYSGALSSMSFSSGCTCPSSNRLSGSPCQQPSMIDQQSSVKDGTRSGLSPLFTLLHSWSLLWHRSYACGSFTLPLQMYHKRIPKAYTSTELSYRPLNSSGAMWMGVPTIDALIIASGLQKPRSVILPRLCSSN